MQPDCLKVFSKRRGVVEDHANDLYLAFIALCLPENVKLGVKWTISATKSNKHIIRVNMSM